MAQLHNNEQQIFRQTAAADATEDMGQPHAKRFCKEQMTILKKMTKNIDVLLKLC